MKFLNSIKQRPTLSPFFIGITVLLLLSSCSAKKSQQQTANEMDNIQSNVFHLNFDGWQLVRADSKNGILRDSGNTEYYALQEGSLDRLKTTREQLTQQLGGLVHGHFVSSHADSVSSWWHPETEGVGDYIALSVESNHTSYFLLFSLYDKSTNALLYVRTRVSHE